MKRDTPVEIGLIVLVIAALLGSLFFEWNSKELLLSKACMYFFSGIYMGLKTKRLYVSLATPNQKRWILIGIMLMLSAGLLTIFFEQGSLNFLWLIGILLVTFTWRKIGRSDD
ncbi:MAG: hypothetical protein MH132_09965 [Hydrotalea sp.]|jgi:hypothetical protein|nr:hypothetical protein [Hydrotalea sp.]